MAWPKTHLGISAGPSALLQGATRAGGRPDEFPCWVFSGFGDEEFTGSSESWALCKSSHGVLNTWFCSGCRRARNSWCLAPSCHEPQQQEEESVWGGTEWHPLHEFWLLHPAVLTYMVSTQPHWQVAPHACAPRVSPGGFPGVSPPAGPSVTPLLCPVVGQPWRAS